MKTSDMEVTLLDHMGSDLSVVNAARVSFDKESDWVFVETDYTGSMEPGSINWGAERRLSEQDEKLIKYLATHKHTSPFNHCFASFRVKAPIFVARQLVKHKFLPWNEVSRRYVDSEPEFYIPEVWRKRAENVKQGSLEQPSEYSEQMRVWTEELCEEALCTYDGMLNSGICPEQARMVLPQNTMTEWVWSGSLGAWADMCRLRLDPHAQKETQEIAKKISKELKNLYPVSWKYLINEVESGID